MKNLFEIAIVKGFRTFIKYVFTLLLLVSVMVPASLKAQEEKKELPKHKQTNLGLYVTSSEAYQMWENAPDKVKILDVRTLDEYIYIGHAEPAFNITAFFQTQEWDADKHHFSMKPNANFLKLAKQVFKTDDIILVTCRSGSRSAMAINQLSEAGFKNLYNITDGFEGDKVEDPESTYIGKRMMNGWKNSGLPYTYNINPKQVVLSE